MFDSIELRQVQNGYVVTVHTEDDTTEYIFDTHRKTLRFIKGYLEGKTEPA